MSELDSWDVSWEADCARGTKVSWQTAGSAEPFVNPVDLAVAEDDDVLVLDAGLGHIFRLGNSGNVTEVFGRFGTGPGELGKGLVRLFLGPDGTVYVPNPSARRLEQFGQDGAYRGALSMPFGSGLPVGYAAFSPHRVFRAASTLGRDAQDRGVIEPAVEVSRLFSDTASVITRLHAGTTPQTGLYAAMPVWAASLDGIFLGSTDRFELWHSDSAFSLLGVWKSSLELPELTAPDIAVLVDQELGRTGMQQREQAAAALVQRSTPSTIHRGVRSSLPTMATCGSIVLPRRMMFELEMPRTFRSTRRDPEGGSFTRLTGANQRRSAYPPVSCSNGSMKADSMASVLIRTGAQWFRFSKCCLAESVRRC